MLPRGVSGRGFVSDPRGGLSVTFAAALMILALLSCGGIEMASLFSERSQMQAAADAAALAGAGELALSTQKGVEARAEQHATIQLAKLAKRLTLKVAAKVVTLEDKTKGVRVAVNGSRPSFFGNLFPPGGFKVAVASTAVSVGRTPLCVLVHGEGYDKLINVKDSALIQAPGCLIHSNEDIEVENSGHIVGERVQSVAEASGAITPSASTGAETIPDPFGKLNLQPPKCPLIQLPSLLYSVGLIRLPSGMHCQDIVVLQNATLELAPGEHWFVDSTLVVKENATLKGADVALIFDRDSKFQFQDRALVDLEGRRSGTFAGFLILGRRDNTNSFEISSDHVKSLLGTIYMPKALLIVDGSKDVAKQSDWTVIVAERLQLKGAPKLVINTNYSGSPVPVPKGVGPGGGSRLVD